MTADPRALGLVVGLALLRGVELAWARRNARRLLARGAHEFDAAHTRVIVVVHSLFFVALTAEVLVGPWRTPSLTAAPFLVLLGLGLGLRAAVHASLGSRWTTRVLVVPGERPIRRGVYKVFRHPNYVAVIGEVVGLAGAVSAWATLAAFAPLHAWVLLRRIRGEEAAWREIAGQSLDTP